MIVNVLDKRTKRILPHTEFKNSYTDKNTIFLIPISLMTILVITYDFNNFAVGLNVANISPGSYVQNSFCPLLSY